MPKTTKNKTEPRVPSYLTRSDAQELIDSKVREASRELARDLEKHLVDIHHRLVALEPRRGS